MTWLEAEYQPPMDMNLSQVWGDGEGQEALVCCSPGSLQNLSMV